MKKIESGFSLIELLVTTSIIGILVAISIANFIIYKQHAHDLSALSQLRDVRTAGIAYFSSGPDVSGFTCYYVDNNEGCFAADSWATPINNPIQKIFRRDPKVNLYIRNIDPKNAGLNDHYGIACHVQGSKRSWYGFDESYDHYSAHQKDLSKKLGRYQSDQEFGTSTSGPGNFVSYADLECPS